MVATQSYTVDVTDLKKGKSEAILSAGYRSHGCVMHQCLGRGMKLHFHTDLQQQPEVSFVGCACPEACDTRCGFVPPGDVMPILIF